ncbi:uncharacterized protein [Amphiura filiformis]|uniref:uncharacterized protein n=1 Tax=Amphiura filiformis TaxID=82378 RepID=UPI003B20DD79
MDESEGSFLSGFVFYEEMISGCASRENVGRILNYGKGGFPREILITTLRPDIVIWSEAGKEVIIGELTVPWEDNIDEAHERKLTKYSELRAECKDRGCKASCYPFEVGRRGFVAHSLQKWLRDLGFNRRELKSVSRAASEAAESGSSWVWSKYIQRSR